MGNNVDKELHSGGLQQEVYILRYLYFTGFLGRSLNAPAAVDSYCDSACSCILVIISTKYTLIRHYLLVSGYVSHV